MSEFIESSVAVDRLLKKLGLTKEKEQVYLYWDEVVGKNLAGKIQLVGIKNDTLIIKVKSPAYHQQLKLYQREWIKKINSYIGNNVVEYLKVIK